MYDPEKMSFATNQIHAAHPDGAGPLQTPIYQTSTFIFESTAQGAACFRGEDDSCFYTRLHSPNARECASRIAVLEGGQAGLMAASGMGAISATLWTLLVSGDHVVADPSLYGCTHELLHDAMPRFGVDVSFVDLTDIEALKAALRPETKVVYFETATNPEMKVVDIDAVSAAVHAYDPAIRVMVDNTFASPYCVRPLKHGADIVVHSVTKYLNGHGDVIAGIVVSDAELIEKINFYGLKFMTGASIGPFDAFLVTRGLKTLDIRMERHCDNAMKVARFLASHPAVKHVAYPGLEDHPSHERALRMYEHGTFGGIMSLELNCGREQTAAFCERLKLVTLAVSLGDAFTLIEHPASMTHSAYAAEDLAAIGIGESLLRLSIGLEGADDLIADLKQALDGIEVGA